MLAFKPNMSCPKNTLISFTILSILCFNVIEGANIDVINQCPYVIWAAASPGGGRRLENGQTWQVKVEPGIAKARIWGRTGCNFDANGRGKCDTSDCGGVLECEGHGSQPNTLAELIPGQGNNNDFVDVSIVEGFNIPIGFSPVGASCKTIRCGADINGECPQQLRTKGGCNNPCKVFNTVQYCCSRGPSGCGPTKYSKFFKDRCPDVYSYPGDDLTGLSTCPGGTNYKVAFCP